MEAGAVGNPFEPEGIGFDPNKGTPGEYPPGRENETDYWRMAFDHACTRGCTAKAAALFADAHENDFSEAQGVPTDQNLLARVRELEAQIEKGGASGGTRKTTSRSRKT